MKMSVSRELIIEVICNILALDSPVLHNCYKEISADVNVWFYCLISQEFDAILDDFFILETKYNSALSAITEVGKVRERSFGWVVWWYALKGTIP